MVNDILSNIPDELICKSIVDEPEELFAIFDRSTSQLECIRDEINMHKEQLKNEAPESERHKLLVERIIQLEFEYNQLYCATTKPIFNTFFTCGNSDVETFRQQRAEFWLPEIDIPMQSQTYAICELYDLAYELSEHSEMYNMEKDAFSIADVLEWPESQPVTTDWLAASEWCFDFGIKAGILVEGDGGDGCYRFASPEIKDTIKKFVALCLDKPQQNDIIDINDMRQQP